MKTLLCLLLASFAVGCASKGKVMTDKTERQATTTIEILSTAPDEKTFKFIGMVEFLGTKEDELKAVNFLQKEAGKAGAEAMYLRQEESQKLVGLVPTKAVKYEAHLFVRR